MSVKVIHGDAIEVMRTLEPGSVDAVITDPPYCSGGFTESERATANGQGMCSETQRRGFDWFVGDNMTTSGLVWLLRSMAVEALRVMSPTGSMCVFCDWRLAFTLGPALESAGFRLRNLVVWDKGSNALGYGFRSRHELILHLTQRTTKFYAKDVGNVISAPRVPPSKRLHKCHKPAAILRDLIRVTTPPSGTVLDPFAGSGSTGEAAKAVGRRAILIERDARYLNAVA